MVVVIVVCGEALIDLVPARAGGPYDARAGGGPANIAVGLGRLGVNVALLGRLADDPFGRLLREHLRGSRVNLHLIIPAGAPTTLAVVDLDPNGSANYHFYIDGCADGGWRTRPSLVRDEPALRSRLERWLGLADIVKVSDEDLAWIAPGRPVETVAREWRDMGPTLVVVTRGGKGVHGVGPAGAVDVDVVPVTVVDTVGAGDAFMSGLLAALHTGERLARPRLAALATGELTGALEYAQRVAALTCTRPGADPPWREELR